MGNWPCQNQHVPWVAELASPLLTDLYQLAMLQAYVAHGMHGEAVFEFFVRRLPEQRNFLMAAGLEQLLTFLETLRFPETEIEWLVASGYADQHLATYLREFRFNGDVNAVPEGTVVFHNEPIVQVVAPLPQAQLIESRLVNLLNLQTIIASKAARIVLSAAGRNLIDFGMRRAHGSEAALLAARASYIAGFDGTATVLAERLFDIPIFGTMAHSFVQAHETESAAFENFARSHPENVTLLIDTYDTIQSARKVVELLPRLRDAGIKVRAVRLDSGDLVGLSKSVRGILDDGGASDVQIFASGGLNEFELKRIVQADAPIGAFGIGTDLDVSSDAPCLDCAYKLQEYDSRPRRKRSAGKATWPGRKQVFRHYHSNGEIDHDVVGLATEEISAERMLVPVMRQGRRLQASATLAVIRECAARSLAALPGCLRELDTHADQPVVVSAAIRKLAADVDEGRV